ncbi:hypothetical protein PoB_005918100 [Plakobranchus ocellatus]|uniref:Uncharacterized protein n=1 Tax=Plakobranchus ocellatus TaxID=259542 RepID=A0AAV4CIH7_9GAST|nr:hypothetical protein PoB_005918100 [Plakobranchus ocellatus]
MTAWPKDRVRRKAFVGGLYSNTRKADDDENAAAAADDDDDDDDDHHHHHHHHHDCRTAYTPTIWRPFLKGVWTAIEAKTLPKRLAITNRVLLIGEFRASLSLCSCCSPRYPNLPNEIK